MHEITPLLLQIPSFEETLKFLCLFILLACLNTSLFIKLYFLKTIQNLENEKIYSVCSADSSVTTERTRSHSKQSGFYPAGTINRNMIFKIKSIEKSVPNAPQSFSLSRGYTQCTSCSLVTVASHSDSKFNLELP